MEKRLFLPLFSVILALPPSVFGQDQSGGYEAISEPSNLTFPVDREYASLGSFGDLLRGIFREIERGAKDLEGILGRSRQGRARHGRTEEFRIISWNIQTFGRKVNPKRLAAYREILGHMFSTNRSAKIIAVQELSNAHGAAKFSELLPGGGERWNLSFQDTNDSMDNGFFSQKEVKIACEGFLFAKPDRDDGDRYVRNPRKALHPVRYAYMSIGDFDFTAINLHLTFRGGDKSASFEEFKNVLQWIKKYMLGPGADPDIIIMGDFNLDAASLNRRINYYKLFRPRKEAGGRRMAKQTELIALVTEKTSRGTDGSPVNNYDHFILSGDVFDEEYAEGSAGPVPPNFIHKVEKNQGVYLSDHYPISARFKFTGTGNDGRAIKADKAPPCRAPIL